MKFSAKLGLYSIILAVAVAGAGCKKTPKNVTPIPRGNTSAPVATVPSGGPLRDPGNVPGGNNGIGRALPANDNLQPQDLNQGGGKPVIDNTPLPENLRYGRAEDRAMFAADIVYFDFDRSNLKAGEADKVKRVADFLKGNSGHDLAIEGHCDERGTEEYNRSLGERRALSVRETLVSLGISASRITTTSFGEDQPADPGHDDAAWDKNRRAEFVILLPKVQ